MAARDRPWRKDPRGDRQRIAERFLRGEACREWTLEMPPAEEVTLPGTSVVFCPGLLTGLLPVRAFEDGLPEVERTFGCRVLRADSHPLRGCQANTESLSDVIDRGVGRAADTSRIPPEEAVPPPGGLLMICYSKGAPDLLTLLAGRPELKERLRCVFTWCGATGGSQVADGTQKSLRRLGAGKVEDKLQAALRPLLGKLDARDCFRKLNQTDVTDAVDDLTTGKRGAFLRERGALLDSLDVPFFTAAGSSAPSEVPWFQLQGYLKLRRIEADNDMQVTASAAHLPIPMATSVALVHAHHWDAAYARFPRLLSGFSRNLDHPFPKTAAVVAMVRLAAELGLVN